MAGRIDLRDEDRLPWLETVEPDDEPRTSAARGIARGVLALVLLAVLVATFAVWRHGQSADGDGALIAAPQGGYKVRPDDPGGLKVEGEGDAAIATSAGARAGTSSVDLKAVPEAPVASAAPARPTAQSAPAAGRNAVAQVPESGGRLVAAPPVGAARVNVSDVAGGALVQLGAYPSEASANAAWGIFAKRFGYLAPLGKSVERADVNGRTVYRLRVNAGSTNQAVDICGRLRVAGEGCFVTS